MTGQVPVEYQCLLHHVVVVQWWTHLVAAVQRWTHLVADPVKLMVWDLLFYHLRYVFF